MKNVTSLMDLQVGWRFTRGQHVSEIQEATLSERGSLGLCQMSSAVALWHWHAFISHLDMRHLFSHVLLKDIYRKCNESFLFIDHFRKDRGESVMSEPLEGCSSRSSNGILSWMNDKYLPWNYMQDTEHFKGNFVTFLYKRKKRWIMCRRSI